MADPASFPTATQGPESSHGPTPSSQGKPAGSRLDWRINLGASFIAQFFCVAGFGAAFPFLPFYVRELGVPEGQVEMWSGLIIAVGAASMAIVSPFWGMLSDRHGRKIMVIRATFGGAVVLTLMAFVGNVYQLFLLRIVQGILTGTIPAFTTLTASFSPPKKVGGALGLMQMGVYTGGSVGPLIGGFVADQLGYRWAFAVTGMLLFLAGLLVVFLIHENFQRPLRTDKRNGIADSARVIWSSPAVLGVVVALGGIYMANFLPHAIMPLYVEGLQPDLHLVNTTTGSVFGVSAVASALAAIVIGRLSDRLRRRMVLIVCVLGAALAFLAKALCWSIPPLLLASFAGGLFIGGLLPSANAVLARSTPKEQQGAVFGLSNSVNSAGRALGPLLGATLATTLGLRSTFLASATILLLVIAWLMVTLKPAPQRPS